MRSRSSSYGFGSTLVDELRAHDRAWKTRPLLRRLYTSWFESMAARLAPGGPTIELGAGIARFNEVVPDSVATDVEPTPWANAVVDAENLPYANGSVANLVLIDVFHHIADVTKALDEAKRVLRPGGRLLVCDPYCSPLSTLAYRRFHHERTDLSAPPFERDATLDGRPMSSNQARATLVFYRHVDEFRRRWPELCIVERRRFAVLAYPLSGGFTRRPLVPPLSWPVVRFLDRALLGLAPLIAFRCLVVVERR